MNQNEINTLIKVTVDNSFERCTEQVVDFINGEPLRMLLMNKGITYPAAAFRIITDILTKGHEHGNK